MCSIQDITNIVNVAKKRLSYNSKTAKNAISVLDLTSLNDTDTLKSIENLCELARTPAGNTAAVCVYPHFVENCSNFLKKSNINLATVVNFPSGNDNLYKIMYDTRNAIDKGAKEIDCVFPYQQFLKGDLLYVKNVISKVREICGKNITLKIILETGEYANIQQIYDAACLSIDCGTDFLKTSTGKTKMGATPESAATLLKAIKNKSISVGLKVSGGVKTMQDVGVYFSIVEKIMGKDWISATNFRFGASSILGELVSECGFKQDKKTFQDANY